MIPIGFCQCGCGQKTKLAPRTYTKQGVKKGQPLHYLRFHHLRGHYGKENNFWKGGKIHQSRGYSLLYMPNHPRSKADGYVYEHIVIAEKALGKPLPTKAQVHHFPHISNYSHLIICEDSAYHNFLELRYRALKACGHPDWRKCLYCKKWDRICNLHFPPGNHSAYHTLCANSYKRYKMPTP